MQTKLIKMLREEANSVKSCFTTFSFQAIALSGVVLGAIIKYQPHQPYVGIAGILVVLVLITVSKIGNYKYATANRHFGYELFLESRNCKEREIILQKVGWEEALRAWRVVQATVFDEIYNTKLNAPIKFEKGLWKNIKNRWAYNQVRATFTDRIESDPKNVDQQTNHDYNIEAYWFEPTKIVEDKAKWYPGRYLHSMQSILHFIAFIALIPMAISTIQLHERLYIPYITGAIALVTAIYFLFEWRKINARRRLLENGLLSIHSCAIMWEVVVLAHRRALKIAKGRQTQYLKALANEAEEVKGNVTNIYVWIEKSSHKELIESVE